MEVSLEVRARSCHVVDEGSLLDEVVFTVDVNILNLLLGLAQVHGLGLLNHISPLRSKLSHLVSSVLVVEDGEFGTGQPSEMTNLNVAKIEGNEELVVEDHTTDPLIVRPSAQARNGADGGDVSEHHDEATARARE